MASEPNELPLQSVLSATSAQLDIAAEDAESAINSVLESFEAAAGAVEGLEAAMNGMADVEPTEILESVMALRKLLRRSVVDLQFQDRLMQRLAMASREMRVLAGNGSPDDNTLFADGAVPRSAASLYSATQLSRINIAAGNEAATSLPSDEDDDIELF